MSAIARALGPLKRGLALMVGRGLVRVVDDAPGNQELQLDLLADETRDRVEHVQPYGFTAHPIPGAEAVAVCPAGSRDHVVVVVVGDRRYRLAGLAEGEVAMYDDLGKSITLKRDGSVVIDGQSLVVINSPVNINGDVAVDGSMTLTGGVVAQGDVVGQGTSLHTHVHGQVKSGLEQSGGPV